MSTLSYRPSQAEVRYFLLIPHPDTGAILLLADGPNWTLPHLIPQDRHFGIVNHLNEAALLNWAMPVVTLRCLRDNYAPNPQAQLWRAFVQEIADPYWQTPIGGVWVAVDDLPQYPLTHPEQANMIKDWVAWRANPAPQRPAWTQVGWYQQVADWMSDVADRMDMLPTGPVQQERIWSRSAVLSLSTDKGRLFLKAVPFMLNYEPIITRVLSIRYPEHIPSVRAVHVDNGWMLLQDWEGPLLQEVQDLVEWEAVLRLYAGIQQDFIPMTQTLVSLGLPDRSVDNLSSQVDRIMLQLPTDLTDDEKRDLRRAAPMLRSWCFELAEYNLPLTLGHGDLWLGNMALSQQDNLIIFDWSDSTVTHPFFDLPFFLMELPPNVPDVERAKQRLRDTYLECWTRYAPIATLRRAYQLVEVLGPLHQAVSYQRYILPGIEELARWEQLGMVTYLLRQVLRAYQALASK